MRALNLLVWLWVIMLTASPSLMAQISIPIGQWQIHASYASIVDVDFSDDHVYAAAPNGVMVLDREESSITTLTRLNGLNGSAINKLKYHQPTDQLIITYEDGTFDVIRGNEVSSFDPSQTTVITGSKAIHEITIHGNHAYMATDYGVLVFDLTKSEIKETWRDVGDSGSTLAINGSTIMGDSIFLATAKGVIAGKLTDNLLDFSKWKRMTIAGEPSAIEFIQTFNSRVFVVINNKGVYEYSGYAWEKKIYLDEIFAEDVSSSDDHLLVTAGNVVYIIDGTDVITEVTAAEFNIILSAVEEPSGKIWIGDSSSGLLGFDGNTVVPYIANGPAQNHGLRLRYLDNKIYFPHGGYDHLLQPKRNTGQVSVFEKGTWAQRDHVIQDITDIQITFDKQFVSSFGYGVKSIDQQSQEVLYDENNSPLVNIGPPGRFVNISAMLADGRDLWAANYGTPTSLHKVSADGTWDSYDFPVFAAQYPLDLERDYAGRIWMRLNPTQGGGIAVLDPSNRESRYLTEADNSGELPSRNVHAIESDRDGNIWVGTDRGAAYFFDAGSDAVRPIIGNIYLLLDDRVTAIETDGGNRKWMGTERGVWLINPTGESSVFHFTTENSPLLSDKILDIEIDHKSGEVFILTDKGLVSYRGDATESNSSSTVKIFPNPVHANYTGVVGITGLPTDAEVKITDVSGKLVWQSRANGGSISWDAKAANGKRVSTGIYLVFAATGSGPGSVVGKVAVIN